MGNCCGSTSITEIIQNQDHISPENPEVENKRSIEDQDDLYNYDQNYHNHDHHHHDNHDHVETTTTTTTSATTTQANTPFFATPSHESEATKMKILPLVDPRLVSLLDFFRQLYLRREAIFNKIIPAHRKDFETIFGQMKSLEQLEKKNSRMGGKIRERSMSFGDVDDLKLERFKVKPIDFGQPPPKGGQGQGGAGSKPPGSK